MTYCGDEQIMGPSDFECSYCSYGASLSTEKKLLFQRILRHCVMSVIGVYCQLVPELLRSMQLMIINIMLCVRGLFHVKQLWFIKFLLQKVWIKLKLLKEEEI